MNTFVRFFIKNEDGRTVCMDMPIPQGMVLQTLMHAVRTDGFVCSSDFFIPYDQIKYAATYNALSKGSTLLMTLPGEQPETKQ